MLVLRCIVEAGGDGRIAGWLQWGLESPALSQGHSSSSRDHLAICRVLSARGGRDARQAGFWLHSRIRLTCAPRVRLALSFGRFVPARAARPP